MNSSARRGDFPQAHADTGTSDAAMLVGRLLLAFLFLYAGIGKATAVGGTAAYIGSKGLPVPELLAWGTIALELVGGAMLAIGLRARWAAIALALFTAAAAVLFHDFWASAAEQVAGQRNNFLKNLAICGGLLYVWATGAGRWSMDGR
jgi:putative oxidoreductase